MEFPQSSQSIPKVHRSVPIEFPKTFPKSSHRVPYHEEKARAKTSFLLNYVSGSS
jgi:hypothetical protein